MYVIIDIIIGNYEEALIYYKEALEASRSVLGNTHPSTLVSISNMGDILSNLGKRLLDCLSNM